MDTSKAFVFTNREAHPRKRRRIEPDPLHTSLGPRLELHRSIWGRCQQKIKDVTLNANRDAFEQLHGFVQRSSHTRDSAEKLPVGLLLTGPGGGASDILFAEFQDTIPDKDKSLFVSVDSSQGQNLRTFLTNLIKTATSASESSTEDDEDDGINPTDEFEEPLSKGPRLLKYDLQILHNWCKARQIGHVILGIPDGDGLEGTLLNDIIVLLRSWQSRLPFTLLLGIATPVDVFFDRLSYSTTQTMDIVPIKVASSDDLSLKLFEALTFDSQMPFRLGPALSTMLMNRFIDNFQPTMSLISAFKYAHMSYFYGNPLAVMLQHHAGIEKIDDKLALDDAHCAALRNLPSFRRRAEELLSQGEAEKCKALIQSNDALQDDMIKQMQESRNKVSWLLGTLSLVSDICDVIKPPNAPDKPALYRSGLTGDLPGSGFMRELMLYIRKASLGNLSSIARQAEDCLMGLPPSDIDASPDDFLDLHAQLEAEQAAGMNGATDARSSARKTTNAKAEKTRSTIAENLCGLLTSLFDQTLQPYQSIYLHEILFYDIRGPHTAMMAPKPQSTIEQALSNPGHFLGCECCSGTGDTLSPSNSPTAIIYRLYLESGALINIHDLYTAFKTMVDGQVEGGEQRVMALFYRGLAELKSLGFIKHSRKRVDHVAKLMWKGL